MIKIILFYCLIISLFIGAVANIIDRDALLALKAHITHDPTNFLAKNWNTSSSVCNWTGVICDVHSHRVITLNITLFSLTGTIPSQLGNLSSLRTLDLSYNRFSGEIPHELGKLAELETLKLQNNFLIGTIPLSIFTLSFVLELDLSYNNLTGIVPSHLGNMSSLQLLDLSENKFFGSFPSFISNKSSLQGVDLTDNILSGELPANICNNLHFLRELDLSGNVFHGKVPSALSKCKYLQILTLSMNNFSGVIPKEIGNLTKLEELYLGFNKFEGEIPWELGNLAELEIITLRKNLLIGTIPRSIFNLSFVLQLDLTYNNLTGEIPHEIGHLHNLELLVLGHNRLVGVAPITIFNMSTLIILDLANNSLSGSLLSSGDVQLPNLEELYLWGNNFSGTIPSFIFNASKLSIISLGYNAFSNFIPNAFGNLRNLRRLHLISNYLKSSTPELSFLSSLSNCKNLESLVLSSNPLDGTLPRAVGNLSHFLERFIMFDCNVRGRIPEGINNLTNLVTIDLGGNKLNGSIPNTLGRLHKLQRLSFRENKFQGSIPDNLCHFNALYQLDLSGNKLSGTIPGCFGNLTSLRYLYLGSNELTSTIPSTFWNLKFILYLNFASNFLRGPLPLEVGNLKVLVEIDLSRNYLSGVIPTTIRCLKDLQYLFLGYNRLQGPIPDIFGELTSLKSLNLSSNNLSGAIPVSLEKLLDLKNLNLSFNKLEGEIPSGGPFVNFSTTSFLGNDLLCSSSNLHVPPCKTSIHETSRKNVLLPWILFPLSTAFMVVVIVLIFRCWKRRKELPKDANMSQLGTWRRFSYLELLRATNEFSENNLIGRGSFGSVYKASLQDEIEIAVKVFHLQFERALKSFDVECEVMKSIRHRNLVKIISSCSNVDFKALILEYMPNGSLEKCLCSINCILDVFQRLNIMIDVASALEYLHFGYSTPIIHCDLKPSNILLDDNLVAHLSDFGIAKLLTGEDQSMIQTQTLATIGYMAPEYGREGQVSTNGDVYSFGIMLMETFTGKKPTNDVFTGDMTLKSWVNDMLSISVMEVVDANLLNREDEDFVAKERCVSYVLNLAIECVAELPKQRINAKEIVRRLSNIRDLLLRDVGGRRITSSNLI